MQMSELKDMYASYWWRRQNLKQAAEHCREALLLAASIAWSRGNGEGWATSQHRTLTWTGHPASITFNNFPTTTDISIP